MDLKKAGLVILVSTLLVYISYFYFDRQLVNLMRSVDSRQYHFLHYIQQLPEPLLYLAPAGILFYVARKLGKRQDKLGRYMLTAGSAILIATAIKILLKFCFGRYWPDTFKENNLSYVHDAAYGFNPFHWGIQYDSFPSGHMITIVTFAVITTVFYPRSKWACVAACVLVAIGLLVLYYHFLGDVIAGTAIGWLIGGYIMKWTRKRHMI